MTPSLPRKWSELRAEDVGELEKELAREICPAHPLSGARVKALYRRYPHDDVLFEVSDWDYPFYCVHLTWSIERNRNWPYITRFRSIEDFCENYQMTLEVDDDHPRWPSERWRFFEQTETPNKARLDNPLPRSDSEIESG
jgi:hypothetical protein